MNHHPSSFRVGQAFPHSESDLADARAADVHERFAELDGRLIRYRDSGGQGPAVLLTHGIGESLEFWHRQMEALGQTLRLIAWDMPGHGLSDERTDAMDLEGQARVAWQLLARHLAPLAAGLVPQAVDLPRHAPARRTGDLSVSGIGDVFVLG